LDRFFRAGEEQRGCDLNLFPTGTDLKWQVGEGRGKGYPRSKEGGELEKQGARDMTRGNPSG